MILSLDIGEHKDFSHQIAQNFVTIFLKVDFTCRFQSNPPTLVLCALLNWNLSVSSSITSITGVTTLLLFSAILSNNGSNQPEKEEIYG